MVAKKQQEVDSLNKKISTSKSKSTIISPPIFDSSIDKSIVTEVKGKNSDDLVNQEKNNNNVEVEPEEDSISRTSSDESIDESSGIVNKKNKNKDDDQEEDSSDESNVILPEFMPLTIETKTVNT